MHNKPVALVTGANQGIGLQIAKELAAKSFTVLVGSRDDARGLRDQRVRRHRRHPGDVAAPALLREAPAGRIVNVSSGVGSLTRNSDPAFPYRPIFGPVYPASKTALNAVTLAMAIELESTGIKVNAACPGYTKTNLNEYAGTETVEEGAAEAVRLALLGQDGPTGTFSHAKLGRLPW